MNLIKVDMWMGCIIEIPWPCPELLIINQVPFHQRAVKRKLSRNGWDTKEGVKSVRKTKNDVNENKVAEESDRKEGSSSKFDLTHLKRCIPLYRWI